MTLDDLLNLAFELAPELQSLELLQHRDDWKCPAGAEAYALHGRHLGIRDEFLKSGRWRGEWPSCIVIVTPEPDAGLLIHELAHVLPARAPLADVGEPTTEQREAHDVQLAAWATGDNPAAPPWDGHGVRFICRALYLRYRAERLGLTVPIESLNVAGPRYGLSMPSCYLSELSAWPQINCRKTFAEIDAEPVPEYAARLWRSDVYEHFRYEAMNAFEEGLKTE